MKSSAAVSSHLRRNATYEDCSAILECLRPAFAPYRESYTPEAFLDTVLSPATLAIRGGLGFGALGKLDASLGCRYLNTANPSVHEPGYQNNLMQVLEPEHRING